MTNEQNDIFEITDEEIADFIYKDLKSKGILMTYQEVVWVLNSQMDFYAYKGLLLPEDDYYDDYNEEEDEK